MSKSIVRPLTGLIAVLLLAPASINAQRPVPLERSGVTRRLAIVAPPVGPPPTNIGYDHLETFGVIAKVVWAPAPNAVGYTVNRRLQEDAACCNASSGPLPVNATSWTDTGLLKKGTYIFTIVVNYADGSVGSGDVYVSDRKGVVNPVVTFTDLNPGRVRLNWSYSIEGTSGAMIKGPGMGAGKMVSGGQVDTPFLPAGTHTWTIASVYSQGLGVLSPPNEWNTATYTVKYGSGKYRISLERFKAINVTAEDPFRNDGRGDEVFITTQVSEIGMNGSLKSTRMARTPTFGDVYNFPGRVRAGSQQPSGGISPNDEYPAAAVYINQLQPATLNNLPYMLWEGTLTQVEGAVILSPAVWESDGGDNLFPYFMTFQTAAAPNVPYRNQFNNYIPGSYGRGVINTWNPQKSCPARQGGEPPTMFVPPINGWLDEPIDMNQDHSYCPTYVVINWSLANAMTTTNPAMVMEIPFTSPVQNWKYMLYVRVEKIP